MAKGNDGNLLQHWVELELAMALLDQSQARRLRVVLTHGMAPYEPFRRRKNGTSGYSNLDEWIRRASLPTLMSDPPKIVFAYRDCETTPAHYPNSAEVLGSQIGRANLIGLITEKVDSKVEALRYRWDGRDLKVLDGSWRSHVNTYAGVLPIAEPWLISMDPITFLPDPEEGKPEDDANLRPSDLQEMHPVFRGYLESGQPGVISIFCFSLRRERLNQTTGKRLGFDYYEFYKEKVAGLALLLNCQHEFCEVPASNPHVAALLSMDAGLIGSVKSGWEMSYMVAKKAKKRAK